MEPVQLTDLPTRVTGAGDAATVAPFADSRDRVDGARLGSSRHGYTFRRLLVGVDALALLLAGALANAATGLADRGPLTPGEAAIFAAFVAFWVLLAGGAGLYHQAERRVGHTFADELASVFMVTTAWAWLLILAFAAVSTGPIELLWPAVAWSASVICVLAMRSLARAVSRNRDWYRQAVVLIGDSDGIERVLRRILRHPEWGLNPVAAIRSADDGQVLDHLADGRVRHSEPIEGQNGNGRERAETLAKVVDALDVTRAIVTDATRTLTERIELVRILAQEQICVDHVSGGPETAYSSAMLYHLEGLPILSVQPSRLGRGAASAKRAIDIGASTVGLLLLSPFFAYAAVRIKLNSRGGVFFWQPRVGREGEVFEMVKFRTMVPGADAMRNALRDQSIHGGNGGLLKLCDDPRITGTGRWLRRWSLDELPQLWNVLRGDMSLVGPRPLPLDEAPLVTDHFRARLRMRPGITGPWQTQGRSDIPFEDMVKLDYTYVVGWSMREDLNLLLRTTTAVLRGRGAY